MSRTYEDCIVKAKNYLRFMTKNLDQIDPYIVKWNRPIGEAYVNLLHMLRGHDPSTYIDFRLFKEGRQLFHFIRFLMYSLVVYVNSYKDVLTYTQRTDCISYLYTVLTLHPKVNVAYIQVHDYLFLDRPFEEIDEQLMLIEGRMLDGEPDYVL